MTTQLLDLFNIKREIDDSSPEVISIDDESSELRYPMSGNSMDASDLSGLSGLSELYPDLSGCPDLLKGDLLKHTRALLEALTQKQITVMRCNMCPGEFRNQEELAVHIKEKHSEDVLTEYLKLLIAKQSIGQRRPYSNRKGHPSWKYFQRIDRYDAMCLLCTVRVRSACSTNLTRHLTRHHPTEAELVHKEQKEQHRPPPRPTIPPPPSTPHPVRDRRESVCSTGDTDNLSRGVVAAKSPRQCLGMDATEPPTQPHHPVALRPAQVLSHLDLPLDLPQWCPFPNAYQELRPIHTGYELHNEQTNVLYDIGHNKYEMPKYDYHSTLTATNYDTPKIFPTEPHLIKQEEKGFEQQAQLHSVVVSPMSMVEFQQTNQMLSTQQQQMDQSTVIERAKMDTICSKDGPTPAKRGRPTENPCWNYFIRLDDQNVRCRICSKIVKSACATNMTKHLERHHQNDYQHLIVQIKQYRQQKGPQPILPLTPLSSSPLHSGCIVSTSSQFVKAESPYVQDIYAQQFDQNEALLRNYVQFDANNQQMGWQRSSSVTRSWGGQVDTSWTQNVHPDPSTSGMEVSWPTSSLVHPSGVDVPNGSPQDKPYLKRNRKTEHPVWEFFKRTVDGNAQCSICTGVVKSPCSSNFMRHLMRHHSIEYNTVYVKWVQKRGNIK